MKKNNYTGYSLTCQICRADNLKNILNLGHQPIVQEYLRAEELHESETRYPLNLVRCSNCSLVQIDYVPEPGKVFFPDYPYRTGLTSMLIRNFLELADVLEKKYELKPKDLIVDIGSNDGTLLKGFKAKGMQVLGIEPTNAAKDANKNGITTFQTFFDKASVTKAKKNMDRLELLPRPMFSRILIMCRNSCVMSVTYSKATAFLSRNPNIFWI